MASKKHRKNRKIIPYRRPRNDIGKLIFGVIFVYLLINIFIYMGHEKIQFYEVSEGGIVNDRPYTGLILREEQVYNADNSGYINYYLREGKRGHLQQIGERSGRCRDRHGLERIAKIPRINRHGLWPFPGIQVCCPQEVLIW